MVNRSDEPAATTPLEERSKRLFDESVDRLDGSTRSALTQARHAALAELEEHKRPLLWRIGGPLSGVAAAAFVLLVILAPMQLSSPGREMPATPFEDIDIVADADHLEMLRDLEFYAWLDSAETLPNDG